MNDGKPPCEPRRREPAKRFAFTEPKLFDAEVEHRRKPRHDVESAMFDFGEVDDEPCGELALRADELSDVE